MLTWLFTKTPLFFFTQSFWRDEAFSYFMAKKNIVEMIFLTAKDFNPPLYYSILHFWMKIFGTSEIAIRSLSLVFFWGTIYVVFLFLNNIFKIKEKKAFLYLFLFIINPLLLYYSFEARMYSMLAFFASLSFYSFCKKDGRLYIFSTVAGLFTHYFMVLVVFGQLIFLLFNKKSVDYIKPRAVYFSMLLFLPWLIFFLSQNNFPNSFWITKPHLKDLLTIFGVIYTGNEASFYPVYLTVGVQNVVIYLSFIFTVIIAFGISNYYKNGVKKDKSVLQLLFIWGIGIPLAIYLISFIKPIYFPRYLIFTSVGFLLLNIFILERINIFFRILLVAILIFFTFTYQKLQLDFRKKTNLEKTLQEIKILAHKGDKIYVDDLDFFTIQYYFGENNVYIYGKSYHDIPSYNGKILIPKEKVAQNLPYYPKKAFIINQYGQYTISSMY